MKTPILTVLLGLFICCSSSQLNAQSTNQLTINLAVTNGTIGIAANSPVTGAPKAENVQSDRTLNIRMSCPAGVDCTKYAMVITHSGDNAGNRLGVDGMPAVNEVNFVAQPEMWANLTAPILVIRPVASATTPNTEIATIPLSMITISGGGGKYNQTAGVLTSC